MSFKDKVVLVTGASSGIGAATAVQFSTEGATVALVGRSESKLKEVAAKCQDPLVLTAELSNDNDVKRIIQQTIEKFGKLDVLVNSAGLDVRRHISDTTFMESYYIAMNVNFRAIVLLTNLAVPYLIKTKGNIVNISSAGEELVTPGLSMYCASKAALNNFTSCTAAELALHGVRANIVSPGLTKTGARIALHSIPQEALQMNTALNRTSEPDEIADVVLFLASDKAIGITGSNFTCDNGLLLK